MLEYCILPNANKFQIIRICRGKGVIGGDHLPKNSGRGRASTHWFGSKSPCAYTSSFITNEEAFKANLLADVGNPLLPRINDLKGSPATMIYSFAIKRKRNSTMISAWYWWFWSIFRVTKSRYSGATKEGQEDDERRGEPVRRGAGLRCFGEPRRHRVRLPASCIVEYQLLIKLIFDQ